MQNFLPTECTPWVVDDEFVRVEMFRFENTYDLLITRHWLECQDGRRAKLRSRVLFLGRNGFLETELWGKDGAFRGRRNTSFPHPERRSRVTGIAVDGYDARVTEAVCCCGCRHSHLLEAAPSQNLVEVPA